MTMHNARAKAGTMARKIDVKQISADLQHVQQRVDGLNISLVGEYAAAIEDGAEFPAVVVYDDGKTLWLSEGFHRLEAHRVLDLDTIRADVRKGNKTKAIENACGANADHGCRRTNADKRKAVTTLLKLYPKRSNRWIAEKAAVSRSIVDSLKNQLAFKATPPSDGQADSNGEAEKTVGKDGKFRRKPKRQPSPPKHSAWIEFESIIGQLILLEDGLLAKYGRSVSAMIESADWDQRMTSQALNHVTEAAKIFARWKKELKPYVES